MPRRLCAALVAAAAGLSSYARADVLLQTVYSSPGCTGTVVQAGVLYPGAGSGCLLAAAGASVRVSCYNATAAKQSFYASEDCSGPSLTDNYLPLGCEPVDGGNSALSACSTSAYAPPSSAPDGRALALTYIAGFPGASTCAALNPNTLTGEFALVLDTCLAQDASTNVVVSCNATHVVTTEYAAAGCAGTPTGVTAHPIGCSEDSNFAFVYACTPSGGGGGGDNSNTAPSDGVPVGAVAGGVVGAIAVAGVAAGLAWRWRRGPLNGAPEARRLL